MDSTDWAVFTAIYCERLEVAAKSLSTSLERVEVRAEGLGVAQDTYRLLLEEKARLDACVAGTLQSHQAGVPRESSPPARAGRIEAG